MSQFHTLKVKSITKETKDAVSISFDIPDNLKNSFTYKSGQFITFAFNLDNHKIYRSYSLCSSPELNEDVTIGVKIVKGGKISTYLNEQLKVGDTIEAMSPTGTFYIEVHPDFQKHYVLFSGGSGITPMFSILKSVLAKEPKSKITLFYGNYNSESVIFKDQLLDLESKNGNQLKVIHVFDKPQKLGGFLGMGKKVTEELAFIEGMITKQTALKLIKDYTDSNFYNIDFFICGPVGLMDNVSAALKELQVPAGKVHREYFSEKSADAKLESDIGTANDEPFTGKCTVTVVYSGKEHILEMDKNQTVLDAALDAEIDAPFSCMVGDCNSCRAKLLEGKVHMNDSLALSPAELKKGYILTCQSHPRSNHIKISYD